MLVEEYNMIEQAFFVGAGFFVVMMIGLIIIYVLVKKQLNDFQNNMRGIVMDVIEKYEWDEKDNNEEQEK